MYLASARFQQLEVIDRIHAIGLLAESPIHPWLHGSYINGQPSASEYHRAVDPVALHQDGFIRACTFFLHPEFRGALHLDEIRGEDPLLERKDVLEAAVKPLLVVVAM